MYLTVSAMHRVGSASNGNNSTRPRKEKRLTYVLNDSDDTKVSSLFYLLIYLAVLFTYLFYLFQGSLQVSCLLLVVAFLSLSIPTKKFFHIMLPNLLTS